MKTNRKYDFTGETKQYGAHLLHRIIAIRDFNNVKNGDLGGCIEKENNLSHTGDCWGADEAKVYDNAKIYGNAESCENGKIHGNAWVNDNDEI